MPLTVTVNSIAECLRTDCNILEDKKKCSNILLSNEPKLPDTLKLCVSGNITFFVFFDFR